MAAPEFESGRRILFVLKKMREVGRLSVAQLGQTPGWTAASASRYLAFLAKNGWLEKVKDGRGRPLYILGREYLQMPVELKEVR